MLRENHGRIQRGIVSLEELEMRSNIAEGIFEVILQPQIEMIVDQSVRMGR